MRLAAVLAALLAATAAPAAEPLAFKRAFHPVPGLLHVVDGDTIVYRDTRYRLIGFDAPELHVACQSARGKAAKARLEELLREPPNRVLIREARAPRDKYGRVLAVALSNRRDVGPILIREGLAKPYAGGRRPAWC